MGIFNNKQNIKISVLMSAYNEPLKWLSQSVDSILQQTFKDFEFIIICDNPYYGQGTQLLKDYAEKDKRITLIINEENIGLTKSLNKGLAIAKGDYIARMDADDISMPNRLEKQFKYMESHPDVIVLGCMIKRFGQTQHWHPQEAVYFSDEDLKAQMLFGNCIAHPTAIIRNKVLTSNQITYDENYRHSQDYRLWEQLMAYGKFAKLKDVLLKYRVSEQQITKSNSSSQGDLSLSISYRCQKRWLESEGFSYTIDEIKNKPFEIINEIKFKGNIRHSNSFRAFVQFTYLYFHNSDTYMSSFIKGDFRYMSFWNSIRYLLHVLKNNRSL